MSTYSADILLQVRDLKVGFRNEEGNVVPALKGVNFDVPAHGTVAMVGESGSGKSVSALAVLGLLPQSNAVIAAGSRIVYDGRDLLTLPHRVLNALRGKDIAMVFQEPMSSLNPVFTIGYQLREVLKKHMRLRGGAARQRAIELLHEVGIPQPQTRIDAYPHQLSGGQQQRAMIAMAIACQPRLLIADEPTTALDVTVQRQVLHLMRELQQRHRMAMLFITHDLGLVADIADQVVVMRDGVVREHGVVSEIFTRPQDAYTKALLACRPPPNQRPARLPVVEDFLSGKPSEADVRQRQRGVRGDEEIILEVRRLAKHFHFGDGLFGKRQFTAVSDASFRLARGRTLGVVGESGSGKTTLALAMMRLTVASSGEVLFQGTDLLKLDTRLAMTYKRRMQMVFQNPYASLNPRFTAGQTLLEPMRIHGIGHEAERVEMALELLGKVGLPESAFFKYPHEFSGGQRQRIAIARCLTMKPEVLICDEAVSALDLSVQAQLLNLLQDLQDEYRMSYVFISHDLAVVRYMSDQVMVMKDGEIVEMGDADELYARPAHPYTQQLLTAMPGITAQGSPAS